jgi:hypothetical protein
MAVTAKVKLDRKADAGNGQVSLSFSPDYQDGRNAEWSEATPALSVSMTVKGDVAERFTEGGKYTLTFEPSED